MTWLEAAGWVVSMLGFGWHVRTFYPRARGVRPVVGKIDLKIVTNGNRTSWATSGDMRFGPEVPTHVVLSELEDLHKRISAGER